MSKTNIELLYNIKIFITTYILSTIWLFSSLSFVYIMFPLSDPFSKGIYLLYFLYKIVFDLRNSKLGKNLKVIVREMFNSVGNYFNRKELYFHDPYETYDSLKRNKIIYGFAPHHIFCLGFLINGAFNSHWKNVIFCVTKMLEFVPIISEILLLFNFKNVDKHTIRSIMANNKSLSMLPGGFYELCNSKFNYNCHFGIEKTGYIYYALKYGYTIKMCYTFGESSTYSAWTPSKSLSNILAKYNVPFLIFWNKLIPGLFHLPNANTSLITVIGKDIQCKQINNPTRYDVSLIQSVCLASIIDLYYTSINNEVMDIDNKSHLEFTIYE